MFSLIFIRVCGGITNNDFIMELISSMTCCRIERAHYPNTAATGASFLAGLGAGKNISYLSLYIQHFDDLPFLEILF